MGKLVPHSSSTKIMSKSKISNTVNLLGIKQFFQTKQNGSTLCYFLLDTVAKGKVESNV